MSDFSYTYDSVGNRTATNTTRTGVTASNSLNYVYDNIYQLTQATRPLPAQPDETFNYDPLGNRLFSDGQTTNSTIGQANRLLDDTAFTYIYDNNGNLIQKTDKATSETTDYIYDAENQLIRIDLPAGIVAQYRYDGLGRRIEKNVDSVITRYVYSNEDILLEFDGTNTQVARYTHGVGIDEPLIMARGGQSLFYQADGLGSIIDLTDINGTVVQSYVYNSFGNIEQQVGNVVNPYTYTGREIDTETGLYFYRARYYDSIMGRFINEDPIGFAGGDSNLFRYVQNNSINFIDPLGLAQFAIRPLGDFTIMIESTFFDDANLEILHEQLFFEDTAGGNIGFFNRDDLNPGEDTSGRIEDYVRRGPHYDDVLMRKALMNVDAGNYCLIHNNCQHYADKLRSEYGRLERERENTKCQ